MYYFLLLLLFVYFFPFFKEMKSCDFSSPWTPKEHTRGKSSQKETLLYILYIKRDDDGIESTRTISRETRDQQRRRNDYSSVRGHRRLGLGAGVRPRREQRLFEMELPGDAELYAQRDFGARRVQGLCDFFYIGLERKRERRREWRRSFLFLSLFLSLSLSNSVRQREENGKVGSNF